MKPIANIFTNKPFMDNEIYNVAKSKVDLIDGLPTLVIGWDFTKQNYPNANILSWEIESNIYWTYGKREKRNRFEENLENFQNLSIKELIKAVKYKFLNVLTSSEEDKRDVYNIILSEVPCNVYIGNDMVYIWDGIKSEIIGLSLRDMEYEGKNPKPFISAMYKNNNRIVEPQNCLSASVRAMFKNHYYLFPYLCA